MDKVDYFFVLFIAYGIYCMFQIRDDYQSYKRTKSPIRFKVLVTSTGMIIASFFMTIYLLAKYLNK